MLELLHLMLFLFVGGLLLWGTSEVCRRCGDYILKYQPTEWNGKVALVSLVILVSAGLLSLFAGYGFLSMLAKTGVL